MASQHTIKLKLDFDGVKKEARYYYLCGIPVWKVVIWQTIPNQKEESCQSKETKKHA